MPLIEHDLFRGEINKVHMAIERLKEFEPEEGYYLAFSGGKDSCVIKALADMSGVKYKAHYHVTTIDPPELIYFMREHHKDVKFDYPKQHLFVTMLEKKMPPTRMKRWCCDVYKERSVDGIVVMGVRREESNKRSKRGMIEPCLKNKRTRYLNAIVDWTEKDVWDFIKNNNIPYCKLYDEGFKRIGCVMCPMATRSNRLFEAEKFPKMAKNWRRWLDRLWDKLNDMGKFDDGTTWNTKDDLWDWWMGKDMEKQDPDQTVMFE